MKDRKFIFQDPSGRRWPLFKFGVFTLGLFSIISAALFAAALLAPITIQNPLSLALLKRQLRAMEKASLPRTVTSSDKALLKRLSARNNIPKPALAMPDKNKNGDIRATFLFSSDPASLEALRGHAAELTHVCPEFLCLTRLDGMLEEQENSSVRELPSDRPYILMPLLDNLDGNERVPEGVENLAQAPKSERMKFIQELLKRLQRVRAGGVVIDWEEVDPGLQKELSKLVEEIAVALRKAGLQTWLCVTMDAGFDTFDLERLAPVIDHFVALLHDENGESDLPGPIASQDWFDGWLNVALGYGDPRQWIASLGTYGYDWTEGKSAAEQISFADAMSRAEKAGVTDVKVVEPALNGTFSYYGENHDHEVWFLDSTSFLNQLSALHDNDWGGFILDKLGSEDPGVWPIIAADAQGHPLHSVIPALENLIGGDSITSVGEGEIVSLDLTSATGKRHFEMTGHERMTCLYETLPSYPTLFRSGSGGLHKVAITFDDGPSPEWTPKILDILKSYHAKATFFLVGREAEDYPDLVQRIVQEGHEVGNHTYTHPNLAIISDARARLEINATQLLIESLTGRSTTLFRPPYNADSHPSDLTELNPIRVAQSQGYMTVLENIDPRDWQRPGVENILERIKDSLSQGNIILLHDGGGNREQTVEALPLLLDYLRERGDEIVSLADLLGMDHDQVMPILPAEKKKSSVFTGGLGFRFMNITQDFMKTFLVIATLLVVIRTIIILVLAWIHSRKAVITGSYCPPVSVIVPAYNEAKVIEKTLYSLLASNFSNEIEVIVVDDGSTDDTAERVLGLNDKRVHLIRQTNSGKSQALRRGVSEARHEYLVIVDADTQFHRDAIANLLKPFEDSKVGAVSGHARVGNLRRFLARCQDLEYVCGFNLDRRAYAIWNCITVVPGAISAFRKAAIYAAGGFSSETLAEDTDLTLAIHRAGYHVDYQSSAIAYTEAPESIAAFVKQRFRWAYGTLQCAWKHRDMIFNPRFKALGWFSLPGIWFFQVVLVAFSPFIDLFFLQALILGNAWDILPYIIVFLGSDLLLAMVAVRMEKMRLYSSLVIIPQRFIYRLLLSYVVWKSILHAMRGAFVGWGKLNRTAAVSTP